MNANQSKGRYAWFLAALAWSLLSGCFMGRSTETKFYLLDYIPTPPKERLDKGFYPYVLRVKDPTIAEAYGRSQIVYRQNAHQMQFYSYHLWAVDPERMVGDLLVKHLRAARLFQNVSRAVEEFQPDYVLSCEVQAIEEYDFQDQWFAHLAVEYRLENQKSGQLVWKKSFDLRHKVAQQEPVYVVRELSALLESIHGHVVSELDIVLDEANYRERSNQPDSQTSPSASGPEPSGTPIGNAVPQATQP
jgi:ABC-type uncharacterized transport system auxiliary subunit